MTLESNKTLGGVGAILLAIPGLNIVGIILVLIAMNGLAEHYQEENIFRNALYGFIFGIIGVVALITVIIMLFVGYATIQSFTVPSPAVPITSFLIFILAFAIMYVFSLISAIYYRRALTVLSEKSNESTFETAGLILLIGAIIPIIGEILRFIAWILAAVGFFSIKSSQSPVVDSAIKDKEKKYCQKCGSANNPDASFCEKCGNKFK